MNPIIKVENLSKYYYISHKGKASYGALKDDVANLLKKPLGKSGEEKHEKFWALKDINFEVNQGEIFGIIGKNGSGKSTLLKILSRIVDPSDGKVKLTGKSASLLEVGTGFHPELTGRENIYFNGSMLGMNRQEIKKKFNEIVEFSEVEKFLDTPVKFYSSGMYVRLAFSVAAYLDSDILILDEVLAVGDDAFQKKSMRKILNTMQEGRTVLFVSHSMDAVNRLCQRGMVLKNGSIDCIGDIETITEAYIGAPPKPTGKFTANQGRSGRHSVMVEDLSIHNKQGETVASIAYGMPINLKVRISKKATLKSTRLDFNVFNKSMARVACYSNANNKKPDLNSREFIFHIDKPQLAPGYYTANVSLLQGKDILEDFIPEAITFEVEMTSTIIEGVTNTLYLEGAIKEDV